ncbi:MAG: LytTR family transcriptional regulator DNA-binding domain-containing protein [Rhizobacter sp.]|nr:LytTR family transcriptional regulator DNA-binding domain-containing protein [Ferruginibacter sp.]
MVMKQIEVQSNTNRLPSREILTGTRGINLKKQSLPAYPENEFYTGVEKNDFTHTFFQHQLPAILNTLLEKIKVPANKKNFLVFKHNKYINVPTQTIAYFHVKYETAFIVSFDRQEYAVNYSLEQLQQLLPDKQFFRLNRQYLASFDAVKEVEHYFARKLLVNLAVPTGEKLLVSKERSAEFLRWLENR